MSTPSDPQLPPNRSALEPTHVMRRRRSGALSELVRQVQERERDPDDGYEFVAVPVADTAALPRTAEDDTQELPPYITDFASDDHYQGDTRGRRAARTTEHGRTSLFRRTAIAIAAVAAALAGFSAALLLTWDRDATDDKAQAPPPAASSAPAPSQPAAAPDPDGAGTLREGDSGPEVSDLQERLLRIPNVYEGGTASGLYDATLTEAVARFQLWYGIRGDESGVYGNDTRNDLESRTAS